MDLQRLAKDKRINCFYRVGGIVMRFRPLLKEQLGRIKRGISRNAGTSEYNCLDEGFTSLVCITSHLYSLQLFNWKLTRHPPQTHHFSLCRTVFASTHYTLHINYFLVHNFLAASLIKYSVWKLVLLGNSEQGLCPSYENADDARGWTACKIQKWAKLACVFFYTT